MPTSEEAEELYDQLIAVLEDDQWQNRFSQVVGEVREAVARGKPARGEISVAGKRKREVVRRVEPLSAHEQLEILIGALEFSLVTPVDLANTAVDALSTEETPIEALVFERDSAGFEATVRAGSDTERTRRSSPPHAVAVATSDIRSATVHIEPLRAAIRAIQRDLRG